MLCFTWQPGQTEERYLEYIYGYVRVAPAPRAARPGAMGVVITAAAFPYRLQRDLHLVDRSHRLRSNHSGGVLLHLGVHVTTFWSQRMHWTSSGPQTVNIRLDSTTCPGSRLRPSTADRSARPRRLNATTSYAAPSVMSSYRPRASCASRAQQIARPKDPGNTGTRNRRAGARAIESSRTRRRGHSHRRRCPYSCRCPRDAGIA